MSPVAQPPSSTPAEFSRRRVLETGAWSVPILAVGLAAPLAAASTVTSLTWGPIEDIAACESSTTAFVTLTNASGPVQAAAVVIALPVGVTWADGTSAPRTLTTGADGRVLLNGVNSIQSTGLAGEYTITATSSGSSAATATFTVTATTSAIWYAGGSGPAQPADSGADVQNPVQLAVAGAFVWAINDSGSLYVHTGATDGPWDQVTASGAATHVTASQGTNYGLAVIDGLVYRLNGASTTPDAMPGLPTAPTDVQASANFAYALLPDGTWWWRPVLGSTPWVQLSGGAGTYTSIDVNEGGGYGWAIGSDQEVYWTAPGTAFGATAQPSDPTNTLSGAVQTAIGSSYAYARDTSGTVYSHFAASSSTPWTPMTGLPAGGATMIATSTGANWAWVVAGDSIYYSGNATSFSPADSAGVLPAGIEDLRVGSSYVYVQTAGGQWWRKFAASDGGWSAITGVPGDQITELSTNWGDFSWAIAPAVAGCAL